MSTPFTTEKMAVFAPMPSASVRMATTVNPGDLASLRRPYRRSCKNIWAEPSQGMDERERYRLALPGKPSSARACCSGGATVPMAPITGSPILPDPPVADERQGLVFRLFQGLNHQETPAIRGN